jgi:hypothetical protein
MVTCDEARKFTVGMVVSSDIVYIQTLVSLFSGESVC